MSSLAQPAAERPEVAVVRHPIADARNNVVGYELRFGGSVDLGDPAMDAKATSALLVDAFGDIGLEQLAGRHPAWLTIARNFLVEIGPPPVRPDRAVLQIAAYPAQDDLLGVLQQLGRSGYTIALDDYDGRDDLGTLMSLCSIVRIDVAARRPRGPARRDRRADACRARCSSPPTCRTTRRSPRCRDLGFTYFQGEYFAQPRLFRRTSVATAGLGSLRRLAELTAGDVSFEDLEQIISSDVGLSLKLLRYVNSAFFALPRTVSSVREALTLLGVRTVRRWAVVMAISALPDVHDELVSLALRRARMCEMLGRQRAARGARDAVHDRPLLRRRRAARLPDGRGARLAAVHRGDPGRAAAPRGSQGRAAERRDRLRARRVPEHAEPRRLARQRVPRGPRVGRRRGPRDRLSRTGAQRHAHSVLA